MEGANAEDHATIKLTLSGFGLTRPALEADLAISGFLAGRFDTKALMSELARRAGNVGGQGCGGAGERGEGRETAEGGVNFVHCHRNPP